MHGEASERTKWTHFVHRLFFLSGFFLIQLSGADLDYLAALSIHPLPAPDPTNLTVMRNKPTTSHQKNQKIAPTFLTLVNDQAI